MRIEEEYKKTGYFWLPDNSEKKIPGTLTIHDGGDIELEVIGLFDNSIQGLNDQDLNIGRIVGSIEKDGLVTLDNCFYRQKSISFGCISKSIVYVDQVFTGVAYEKNEITIFNSFTFSVDGLDEWVGISGISAFYDKSHKLKRINYTYPDPIIYELKNGFSLHVLFRYSYPFVPSLTEAKITQRAYLRLSSETAKTLSEFIDISFVLTRFLCFAINSTLSLDDVSVTSNSILNDQSKPIKIKTYYRSQPFIKNKPKIDNTNMLFTFEQIRDDFSQRLDKWFLAYDTITPALDLYFSTKTDACIYLETHFLDLAQGLETYHRRTSEEKLMSETKFDELVEKIISECPDENKEWLQDRLRYGNEISLSQRIKRIIEPFKEHIGNSKKRSKLIRKIVNTRNYLTHYNEELKPEVAIGDELYCLCLNMEAILQLHFLKVLGFSHEKINSILDKNYKLKQKLS